MLDANKVSMFAKIRLKTEGNPQLINTSLEL